MSAKWVQMEDKRMNIVKNWPKPKSIWDIQIFLRFANFYQRFVEDFGKIAGSLTSMLRTNSTSRSANNLLSKMAVNAEIGGGGDGD